MKEILVVAAENSAENYGAQVLDEFRRRGGAVRFFGIGGERLRRQGVEILFHNRDFAIVGIVEILRHLLRIRRALNGLFRAAVKRRAAAALLIDFPDFNLRLARRLSRAGIPVYYYISPTVWAWRYGRVKQIRRWVKHLFIIFPFEIPIYEKENIAHTYTGHPLLPLVKVSQERESLRRRLSVAAEEKLLVLLPGSRPGEVARLLPRMLAAAEQLAAGFRVKTCILQAENISAALLAKHLQGRLLPVLPQAEGYNLIRAADLVLTACGTSNLEIALLGVPFVAVYRVNGLSYLLGRWLVRIRRYSIVNILAGRPVVPELIQGRCRPGLIARQLQAILADPAVGQQMVAEFGRLHGRLQQNRPAAEIVRDKMASDLGLD